MLKLRKIKYVLCILFISVLAVGCSIFNKEIKVESMANHKNIKEDLKYGNFKIEFDLLDGVDIRSFEVRKNKIYNFKIEYGVTSGELILEFRDSKNNKLKEINLSEEYNTGLKQLKEENKDAGDVHLGSIGTILDLKSDDNQIKIVLKGKNAKGKINIEW